MTEDQLVSPIPINIARSTLKERFPKLLIKSIKYLGGGSHSVFAVNNLHAFRFPKIVKGIFSIEDAQNTFTREKGFIKILKPRLKPSQVVEQTFLSLESSKSFSGPIAGYDLIDGKQDVVDIPDLLGGLLDKLHHIQPAEFDFKINQPIRQEVKRSWLKSYQETREVSFPYLNDKERSWFQRIYENFLNRMDLQKPSIVLTHGDFDPSNILVNKDLGLITLIDLDELSYGDSATDFCIWLGKYGKVFVNQMLTNYSLEIDGEFLTRSLFYYNRIPHIYFSTGHRTGNSNFIEFGKELLRDRMKAGRA